MASESLNLAELRELLLSRPEDPDRLPEALAALVDLWGEDGLSQADLRDLTIRLLDERSLLNDRTGALDSIARQVGLFPYLAPELLTTAELLAYEAHRPLGPLGSDLVFHQAQNDVYRRLMDGRNVILSAPTSFGKSLILDALLTSDQFDNVFVIVPTLALIDEVRQRVSMLPIPHRVITHSGQTFGERNVFVMTQERVLEIEELPQTVDLFVIDEFYKLDSHSDRERGELLNQAMYRLFKTGAQMYFLGPNIDGIPDDLPFEADFIRTDFNTVAIDVERISFQNGAQEEALASLVRRLRNEPTLIFVQSPNRARTIAALLTSLLDEPVESQLTSAVEWLGEAYASEWYVVKALSKGIGVHHGRLPRALSQYMVRAFNDGKLNTLICTSTLIEGVNTAAKNVIIYDNRIARQKFDYFTFSNIRGRSGRMFKHFVGRVFLFHAAPHPELPLVDFPVFTQPDDASLSLLLQIDEDDLLDDSRDRLDPILSQSILSAEVMRSARGVDPERLVALAEEILQSPNLQTELSWTFQPRYEELLTVCRLAWDYLAGSNPNSASVRSHRQLAFLVNRLRSSSSVSEFLGDRVAESANPDDGIENALDFLRRWVGHLLPRAVWALQSVQEEVLTRTGVRPGSYSLFAGSLENLFRPNHVVALEEYGIPIELGEKLYPLLPATEDLTDVLKGLKGLPALQLDLHPFEQELLSQFQESYQGERSG